MWMVSWILSECTFDRVKFLWLNSFDRMAIIGDFSGIACFCIHTIMFLLIRWIVAITTFVRALPIPKEDRVVARGACCRADLHIFNVLLTEIGCNVQICFSCFTELRVCLNAVGLYSKERIPFYSYQVWMDGK